VVFHNSFKLSAFEVDIEESFIWLKLFFLQFITGPEVAGKGLLGKPYFEPNYKHLVQNFTSFGGGYLAAEK